LLPRFADGIFSGEDLRLAPGPAHPRAIALALVNTELHRGAATDATEAITSELLIVLD
jgi:hypothetical protein